MADTSTVRDTIERDLGQEIPGAGVVKVAETALLAVDLREYVLTSQLGAEYEKVLARIVESAQAAAAPTDQIGVWVSGFFGSGKSHFAKVLGHLLADTPTDGTSARELFRNHLQLERPADERIAELLQQATTYRLKVHLVPFDIMTLQGQGSENVGVIFLRAFYRSLGMSSVMAFAEQELELHSAGKWDGFVTAYQEQTGQPWAADRELFSSYASLAEVLASVLPDRYPSVEAAKETLRFAQSSLDALTNDAAVDRLVRWVEQRQSGTKDSHRVLFVADEVGAWSGRHLERIEQVRSLVELFASKGGGRLWLIATSQERLSEVVENSPDVSTVQQSQALLQRLEARFPVNIHLESSEVGTVIEQRILRKRPVARPQLEEIWNRHRGQLIDIAEPPGIELQGNYPRVELENFVRDYPFLPYQLPAAAEIFGNMRSVKVSQGARSMLRVALDAARSIADQPIGALVSWDQIFDSANRGNEFQGEEYLGSLGIEHINRADRDLAGIASIERPSRLLKVLWLVQQTGRIPRTVRNLARFLMPTVDTSVLTLEQQVEQTLAELEKLSFVRRDPASDEWRFLTPDEVTVEKILSRIATQDVKEGDVRRERQDLVAQQLKSVLPGWLSLGKTQTRFDYGVFLIGIPIAHESEPVSMKVSFAGSEAAMKIAEDYAAYLSEPEAHWIIELPKRLDERIRRRLAIERLPGDDEFQQKATQRTRDEAKRLEGEGIQLESDSASDVTAALRAGTMYVAGKRVELTGTNKSASIRPALEEAIRERIQTVYHRFAEGDQPFNPSQVDKVLTVAPADRAGLSPELHIFDASGHVATTHPLVDALIAHLKSTPKTAGGDVAAWFKREPFGWPPDLIRYAAAALFADGRITTADQAGRTYDSPKDIAARAQFGTGPFKGLRLLIEENPLSASEVGTLRTLLSDLGHPTKDASELAVAEAAQALISELRAKTALVTRADEIGFPLGPSYPAVQLLIDEISTADTRVKRLRAILERATELREAAANVNQLDEFARAFGFEQFQRTMRLRAAARDAVLDTDATWGAQALDAETQLQALIEQKRALPDWHTTFSEHRQRLLEAFKAVYVPLFEEARQRIEDARDAITNSPEHAALDKDRSLQYFRDWLVTGRALAQLHQLPMKSDDDLLKAHDAYSLGHLRILISSLEGTIGAARQALIAALGEQQKEVEGAERIAAWSPASAFAGKSFSSAEEVRDAFHQAESAVLSLVEQGKTVKVV